MASSLLCPPPTAQPSPLPSPTLLLLLPPALPSLLPLPDHSEAALAFGRLTSKPLPADAARLPATSLPPPCCLAAMAALPTRGPEPSAPPPKGASVTAWQGSPAITQVLLSLLPAMLPQPDLLWPNRSWNNSGMHQQNKVQQ